MNVEPSAPSGSRASRLLPRLTVDDKFSQGSPLPLIWEIQIQLFLRRGV